MIGRISRNSNTIEFHAQRNLILLPDQPTPSAEELPARYLEDASGFRGTADGVIPTALCNAASAIHSDAVNIAGAGTGLTGARVPQGGWVVSLEKFTRLEIHEAHAISGAGVLLSEVHAAAARANQFYPPDPTETSASIGGTIATNASGSRSFQQAR